MRIARVALTFALPVSLAVSLPALLSAALLSAALLSAVLVAPARAADLPPHGTLRILVVGDEVNPHGLSDAELTQPADLMAALGAAGSGLVIDPAPRRSAFDRDR